MVDPIGPLGRGPQAVPGHHIGFIETKSWMARKVRNIGEPAGAQIIDHANAVPLAQQEFGKMRTDEAGAARQQNVHNKYHPFASGSVKFAGAARLARHIRRYIANHHISRLPAAFYYYTG